MRLLLVLTFAFLAIACQSVHEKDWSHIPGGIKPHTPASGKWYPHPKYKPSPQFEKALRMAKEHLTEIDWIGREIVLDLEYEVHVFKNEGSKFDGGIRVYLWYRYGYDEDGNEICGPGDHGAVLISKDFKTIEFGQGR